MLGQNKIRNLRKRIGISFLDKMSSEDFPEEWTAPYLFLLLCK
jgi:hypothetical protein